MSMKERKIKINMAHYNRLAKQIEASKAKIATERDKLSKLISDVEDVIVDCDTGVEAIENGLRELHEGLSTLSQRM